jgi:hypothetical protein
LHRSSEGPETGGDGVVVFARFEQGENTDMTARRVDGSQSKDELLYTVTEAARLLGLSTQTLIMYGKRGLVFPLRNGRKRLFSTTDVKWINCVRELIHVNKFSIEAVKMLLEYAPCWEIKDCPVEQHADCMRLGGDNNSRMLRVAPAGGFSRGLSTATSCPHAKGELREGV